MSINGKIMVREITEREHLKRTLIRNVRDSTRMEGEGQKVQQMKKKTREKIWQKEIFTKANLIERDVL